MRLSILPLLILSLNCFSNSDKFHNLAVGRSKACVIEGTRLYCWGKWAGLIFDNRKERQYYRYAYPPYGLHDGVVTDVDIQVQDGKYGCAVKDGGVWCFGSEKGHLGIDPHNSRYIQWHPRPLPVVDKNVIDVETGDDCACAIKTTDEIYNNPHIKKKSGALYCWGRISFGDSWCPHTIKEEKKQWKDGHYIVPTKGMESGVEKISIAYQHGCLIKNGEVWCWGFNGSGAIGEGKVKYSEDYNLKPLTKVVGLPKGIVDIAVTRETSCAVTNKGELYCWGEFAGPGYHSYLTYEIKVKNKGNEKYLDKYLKKFKDQLVRQDIQSYVPMTDSYKTITYWYAVEAIRHPTFENVKVSKINSSGNSILVYKEGKDTVFDTIGHTDKLNDFIKKSKEFGSFSYSSVCSISTDNTKVICVSRDCHLSRNKEFFTTKKCSERWWNIFHQIDFAPEEEIKRVYKKRTNKPGSNYFNNSF